MSEESFVAPTLDEIKLEDLILSDKQRRVWNFPDKETGEMKSVGENYITCDYKNKGERLAFAVQGLKTFKGVQVSKYKKHFMAFNIKDEKVKASFERVAGLIRDLIFKNKSNILSGQLLSKVKTRAAMDIIVNGFIKAGDAKPDGSGNWDDSLMVSVPSSKHKGSPCLDQNICVFEDLEGNPFNWMALDGQTLAECVFELEKIIIDSNALIFKCRIVMAVTSTKSRRPITTKRKLDATKTETEAKADAKVTVTPTSDKKSEEPKPVSKPETKKLKTSS